MTDTKCRHLKSTATISLLLLTIHSSPKAASDLPPLRSEPYTAARVQRPLSDAARQFLIARNPDTARVWVFFADKNVFTQDQFDSASAAVSLSDKVLQRRTKVDRNRVLFADLPVRLNYVETVKSLGGKHRRTSRWLNAASFDIPMSRLNRVANLPFVASVRPVAGGRSSPAVPAPEVDVSALPQTPVELLNYGTALYQLE